MPRDLVKSFGRQMRVVIADDVPAIVDAVAERLLPDFVVVGRAGDGPALIESALNLKPDLIVTDVSMPKLTGIEVLRQLHQRGVRIPTIILTVHEDEDLIKEALSLGALGFVLKRRLFRDLPLAAHQALNGRTFVSESVAKEVLPPHDLGSDLNTIATIAPLSPVFLRDRSGLLFARTEEIEWRLGMAPGCERKVLFVDDQQEAVTSLVRMDAGTHFPAHRHAGTEEVFIISGDLVVEGQLMNPGDYCRAEANSIHAESYTKSGCMFLLRASQHDEIIGLPT